MTLTLQHQRDLKEIGINTKNWIDSAPFESGIEPLVSTIYGISYINTLSYNPPFAGMLIIYLTFTFCTSDLYLYFLLCELLLSAILLSILYLVVPILYHISEETNVVQILGGEIGLPFKMDGTTVEK